VWAETWQLCAETVSNARGGRCKSSRRPAARKFSHVHVDLVGPLPASSDGHVYLLTIIVRSTRWFETVPLRNMEASTCADAFIANRVARFGVPATVTKDRDAQFTSTLWTAACKSLGIKHVLTTAYHPQSNGMVERMHRQVKDALCAQVAGPAWHSHLPWVLMGLRAAPKEDSAVSSRVPDPPCVNVPPPPMRLTSYAVAANTPRAHLAQVDHMYVRVGGQQRPLSAPYAGPYLVVSKGAKTYPSRRTRGRRSSRWTV